MIIAIICCTIAIYSSLYGLHKNLENIEKELRKLNQK